MNLRTETRIVFPEDRSDDVCRLVETLALPPIVARLLVNRGVTEPAAADLFLNGTLAHLHDPLRMKDMDRAVERMLAAIRSGERIAVSGDYDVDGTTGTALLHQALSGLGLAVHGSIPDRIEEGYGISRKAIDEAAERGDTLLISVDCGISNVEEVAYARGRGIDVIITDHHEPTGPLPDAVAILNPKQAGCPYPFKMLSGVGVAYKLLKALEARGVPVDPDRQLDLVALGTIADIAPLIDENRILAKFGLDRFPVSANYGIRALLELARLTGEPINATHVGYQLAPRINAAGRIGDPRDSLRLFLAGSPAEAMRYAKILDEDNRRRQECEREIFREVEEQIEHRKKDFCITLASDNWHAGVIGIVASKIKEKYYRPTVLISVEKGECRGSARSIAEFSLIDALTELTPLLRQFGGHQLAAGFSIDFERIDAFRREMNRLAAEKIRHEAIGPVLAVDSLLPLADIDERLVAALERLKPFGHGNPRPLFMTRDASLPEHRRVGQKSNHLLFRVRKNGRTLDGIGFNLGDYHEKVMSPAQPVDLIYEIDRNTWNGADKIQLRLVDLKLSRMRVHAGDAPDERARAEELRERGNGHFTERNYPKALDCYFRALQAAADEPELHFNVGLICKITGDYARASKYLGRAAALAPDTDRGREIRRRVERILEKIRILAAPV